MSRYKQNSTSHNSDSSDTDDEAGLSTTFSRKISTNKRLDKSACLKEGYLHILRTTSFYKWKKRYFWLKGKTLFYGRDNRAEIFEEIDLTDASVAEYDNHAFQVITTFRNIVLSTDSRKDMEAWVQCVIHASQQKFYDPNDHQNMVSGQHSWYITSHARPVYCNVCREALPGVTSHGLSCGVCRMKAHKRCAIKVPANCKWSTLATVGDHIIEERDGTLGMGHQWIEGNLPVSSHCSVCDRKCGSVRRLQDFRCLWCKSVVHASCKEEVPKLCPVNLCQFAVLSPIYIHSIDSDGLCGATNCRGLSPLLVFVNSKSGDNQGVKFVRKFKQLLNPAQVFDLMNGGPFPGLRLFQNFDQFRILICGGDGSVGWVLSEVDNFGLHNKCQIAVLPLGTGNDLARVLGWGSVMTDDNQIIGAIDKLEQSQIKMLDRWSILTYEWKQPEKPDAENNESELLYREVSTDESVTNQSNVSAIAECLHKILTSSDHVTVVAYSRKLCIGVSQFLDQLVSLQQASLSSEDTKAAADPAAMNDWSMLKSKLDRLTDALNESALAFRNEDGEHMNIASDQYVSQGYQQEVTGLEKMADNTQLLMSRANSVKKAVKQIMDHTEYTVSLALSEGIFPPQPLDPPHLTSQTSTNSSQPMQSTPNVDLSLHDSLNLPANKVTGGSTPSRKISAVSAFGPDSSMETHPSSKQSSNQTHKPYTSLRVRNAIASKIEESSHKNFIGKMLLANADAVCAALVPPFDDQSIQSEFEERTVMNNYFGIGLDAKIALEFHQQRESHPERFRSRAKNLMTFASLGGREIITRTYRNFEKKILLECDGLQLPLPNLQGIVILNIPSYCGGTNFWGTQIPGSNEPFTTPSFDDKILEVMAVYGSAHIGVSKFINLHYHRIAQCRSVKITILGTDPVPVQVDGEAWLLNPGFIKIVHKNRVQTLTRDRDFEHTLRSWSERQTKDRLSASTGLSSDNSSSRSSDSLNRTSTSSAEENIHLVKATRKLIDCLASLNAVITNDKAMAKCAEFVSLDDATQAGLQELSLCSKELCTEVQDLLQQIQANSHACNVLSPEDEGVARLRQALNQTQKELEKYRAPQAAKSSQKQRHGPFRLLGRLLGRHKNSKNSLHKPSACADSFTDSPVEQWSAEVVACWLNSIGLGEYSQIFLKNDIQGSELMQLQHSDFKDLGITKVGHLKRLETALKSLEVSPTSSSNDQG